MSVTSLGAKIVIGATTLAATLVAVPAGVSHANYNFGVKEIHLDDAGTVCLENQPIPCPNVLVVSQTLVNGRYEFTDLAGTGLFDDAIWLSADFSATCRAAHSLVSAQVDSYLNIPEEDGLYADHNGTGVGFWPLFIAVPDAKTMPTTRLALNLPIAAAFDDGAIGWYHSPQEVFDLGEAEIQRMVDDEGMTFRQARATGFELTTYVQVAFQAVCRYNGGVDHIVKRRFVELPLTMRFEPVDVGTPLVDLDRPAADLIAPPEVTDAELFAVQDLADPCTLHLSGAIRANQPMTVDYRFINPHGQPSNTYSIAIDPTLSALFDRTVVVPMLEGTDPSGDLVVAGGHSDRDDFFIEMPDEQYSGTYMLEVVSPNHIFAGDGFAVDYCQTVQVHTAPIAGHAAGDFAGGAHPTHG